MILASAGQAIARLRASGADAPEGERGGVRWPRLAVAATATLVALAIFELTVGLTQWGWAGWFGRDLGYYTDATTRLLSDGTWYRDRQLHGPYPIEAGDVLYPPVTAIAFIPWLILPTWSFIAIPLIVLGWAVVRMRPALWAWPLMALCLTQPDTMVKVVSANPFLWAAMVVALGGLYRWPAVLALLKPTLAPFALIGIRDRRWWVAGALIGIASLPVLGLTITYPRVVLDARDGGLFYSFWDLPLLLIPTIAWLGRFDRRGIHPGPPSNPSP